MDITLYRKAVVVVVGLVAILTARYGFDLTPHTAMIVDGLLSLGTAFGVYQVPNSPTEG